MYKTIMNFEIVFKNDIHGSQGTGHRQWRIETHGRWLADKVSQCSIDWRKYPSCDMRCGNWGRPPEFTGWSEGEERSIHTGKITILQKLPESKRMNISQPFLCGPDNYISWARNSVLLGNSYLNFCAQTSLPDHCKCKECWEIWYFGFPVLSSFNKACFVAQAILELRNSKNSW